MENKKGFIITCNSCGRSEVINNDASFFWGSDISYELNREQEYGFGGIKLEINCVCGNRSGED